MIYLFCFCNIFATLSLCASNSPKLVIGEHNLLTTEEFLLDEEPSSRRRSTIPPFGRRRERDRKLTLGLIPPLCVQVYIPSSLIVVMSWVSFWLNRGAAPARVRILLWSFLDSLIRASVKVWTPAKMPFPIQKLNRRRAIKKNWFSGEKFSRSGPSLSTFL